MRWNSGVLVEYKKDQINPDDIIRQIKSFYTEVKENKPGSFSDVHLSMQKKVSQLAKKYNLNGVMEYKIEGINSKNAFLDVVWTDGEDIITAFEIDRGKKMHSIKKLKTLGIKYPFLIYYGKWDFKEILKQYDSENEIISIKLPPLKLKKAHIQLKKRPAQSNPNIK